MIVMSHAMGNANVREAARALAEAGLLAEFWTGIAWTPGHRAERLLPGPLVRELRRRSFPAAVRGRVRTKPAREAVRLLATRCGGKVPGARGLIRHETGWCSPDAVLRALDRAVARRLPGLARGGELRGVYAYEDGAAQTFGAARELGLRRFYDLPTGYWRASRAIFAEEAEREPAWAATLSGHRDSAEKLARKDEELALADTVIVASTFTERTLASAPALRAPVRVIPYGAPPPVPESEVDRAAGTRPGTNGPLRVLFVGGLGQQKGLSYLLAAVRQLGAHAELTLLGAKTTHGCAPLEAALRTHRWVPTLPHAEVLAEMARHDVLVFPSLFEGFGLVILEAMSRGLPVIATPNGAGPDVIDDGEDGFIVPIRDAPAIAENLARLRREPARLRAMKHAARAKAATFTWATYRQRLLAAVAAAPLETLVPC